LDHCNNTVEEDGQGCYLIVGGITALVDESAGVAGSGGGTIDFTVDEAAIEHIVKSDTSSLVEAVFSDPVSYELLGEGDIQRGFRGRNWHFGFDSFGNAHFEHHQWRYHVAYRSIISYDDAD